MTFEEIYQQNKKAIFNLALQYTQNTEDAEEITQDVFLKVLDKLNDFREESSLQTWVYRIGINTCLDFLRAKKRKKRLALINPFSKEEMRGLAHFNHPGVQLENKEQIKLLFDCINDLPENQKTALILLKIEHLSQKDAANSMNISEKALESLFQRAKNNLAKMLAKTEGK